MFTPENGLFIPAFFQEKEIRLLLTQRRKINFILLAFKNFSSQISKNHQK